MLIKNGFNFCLLFLCLMNWLLFVKVPYCCIQYCIVHFNLPVCTKHTFNNAVILFLESSFCWAFYFSWIYLILFNYLNATRLTPNSDIVAVTLAASAAVSSTLVFQLQRVSPDALFTLFGMLCFTLFGMLFDFNYLYAYIQDCL